MLDSIRLRIVLMLYGIQNFVLKTFVSIMFRPCLNPKRVLVFRTGSIGDSICAIPSIGAIRKHFSASEITILTTAGSKSPVSMAKILSATCYNKLLDYEGYTKRELLSLVRGGNYDLVIELPQNMATLGTMLRNMFFFRMADIRSAWGWEMSTVFVFKQTQEKYIVFPTETERLLSLVKRNGITVPLEPSYPLRIVNGDREFVFQLLSKKGLRDLDVKRTVALIPGAKRPQNIYPLDRYVELAKWLVGKGYTIVIVGGMDDVEKGRELEQIAGVYSFAGELSPVQSCVLMSWCRITVSNDTGPMHLSYAVGTPVLAIFSSRDFPNKWFPPVGNQVLRNNHIHCSLCLSETCEDNICMKGIPLAKVKTAFEELEKSTT